MKIEINGGDFTNLPLALKAFEELKGLITLMGGKSINFRPYKNKMNVYDGTICMGVAAQFEVSSLKEYMTRQGRETE